MNQAPAYPRCRLTCYVAGPADKPMVLLYRQKLDNDMPVPTLENVLFHAETQTAEARNVSVNRDPGGDWMNYAIGQWMMYRMQDLPVDFHFFDRRVVNARPLVQS